MRSRMARDDQKPPALFGVAVAFGQRLDVAADRRERRPQLVRDVGDEIAADLIGAPQVGDVVQDHDDAVGGVAAGGGRAGNDRAGRIARRRQLQRVRRSRRRASRRPARQWPGCRIVST